MAPVSISEDLRIKAVNAAREGMTQVEAAKTFGVTRQAIRSQILYTGSLAFNYDISAELGTTAVGWTVLKLVARQGSKPGGVGGRPNPAG